MHCDNSRLQKGSVDVPAIRLAPPYFHPVMLVLPSLGGTPLSGAVLSDEGGELGGGVELSEVPSRLLESGNLLALLLEYEQQPVQLLQSVLLVSSVRSPQRPEHPISEGNCPLRQYVPAPNLAQARHHDWQHLQDCLPLVGGDIIGGSKEVLLGGKPHAARAVEGIAPMQPDVHKLIEGRLSHGQKAADLAYDVREVGSE
jgi:hypothetical protein